jgi:hypothetical protein
MLNLQMMKVRPEAVRSGQVGLASIHKPQWSPSPDGPRQSEPGKLSSKSLSKSLSESTSAPFDNDPDFDFDPDSLPFT